MSAPQTIIYLCSGVEFSNSYEHTRYFNSATEQLMYFQNLSKFTLTANAYCRKNWNLRIAKPFEDCVNLNYAVFKNNGRWWFYFITNIQYVGEVTTEVTLELDVMQTYHFDYELLPCFVEREHVSDDTIGANVIEEGLDVGDLINVGYSQYDMTDLCVMILSSVDLCYDTFNKLGTANRLIDNVYSGLGVFVVDAPAVTLSAVMHTLIDNLDTAGKTDAIVAMWMFPKEFVELGEMPSGSGNRNNYIFPIKCAKTKNIEVLRPTSLGQLHYVPKNNKMLCYPYAFVHASNNNGSNAIYKYERSTMTDISGNMAFIMYASVLPDGGVKLIPQYYNGVVENWEESINLNGFPVCAWNSDIYKIWLAQNEHSQNLALATSGLTIAGGLISAVGGVFTGNIAGVAGGVGTMINGGTQIAGIMAQRADKEVLPPQAKGQSIGNVNITGDHFTFSFYHKTVDNEHAIKIDRYLSAYGYKVNAFKVPERTSRLNWNHVKTVSCKISGSICTEDAEKIEAIYNKGVTFWHAGTKICDYSNYSNPIKGG